MDGISGEIVLFDTFLLGKYFTFLIPRNPVFDAEDPDMWRVQLRNSFNLIAVPAIGDVSFFFFPFFPRCKQAKEDWGVDVRTASRRPARQTWQVIYTYIHF